MGPDRLLSTQHRKLLQTPIESTNLGRNMDADSHTSATAIKASPWLAMYGSQCSLFALVSQEFHETPRPVFVTSCFASRHANATEEGIKRLRVLSEHRIYSGRIQELNFGLKILNPRFKYTVYDYSELDPRFKLCKALV